MHQQLRDDDADRTEDVGVEGFLRLDVAVARVDGVVPKLLMLSTLAALLRVRNS